MIFTALNNYFKEQTKTPLNGEIDVFELCSEEDILNLEEESIEMLFTVIFLLICISSVSEDILERVEDLGSEHFEKILSASEIFIKEESVHSSRQVSMKNLPLVHRKSILSTVSISKKSKPKYAKSSVSQPSQHPEMEMPVELEKLRNYKIDLMEQVEELVRDSMKKSKLIERKRLLCTIIFDRSEDSLRSEIKKRKVVEDEKYNLENQVKNMQRLIEELKMQVETVRSNFSEAGNDKELQELKKENFDLKLQLAEKTNDHSKQNIENVHTIDDLNKKLENTQARCDLITVEHNEMKFKLKAAEFELKKLQDTEKKFNNISYEKDVLVEKNEQLLSSNRDLAKEVKDVRELYEQINSETSNLKAKYKEAMSSLKFYSAPKKTWRIPQSIVRTLAMMPGIKEAIMQTREKSTSLSNLKDELEMSDREEEELRKENERLKSTISELTYKGSELSKKIKEISNELEAEKVLTTNLKSEVQIKDETIKTTDERIFRIEIERDQIKNEIVRKELEIEKFKIELEKERLKTPSKSMPFIKESDEQLDEFTLNVSKISQTNVNEKTLLSLRTQVDELTEENGNLRKEKRDLLTKNDDNEREFKITLTSQCDQITRLNKNIEELEETQANNIKSYQDKIKELSDAIASLNQQIKELTLKLNEKTENMIPINGDETEEVSKLKRQLKGLEAKHESEISLLVLEKESIVKTLEYNKSELKSKEEELFNLKEKHRQQIEGLSEQLKELTMSKDLLSIELANSKIIVESVESSLKQLRTEKQQIEEENTKKIESLSLTVNDLDQKLIKQKQELTKEIEEADKSRNNYRHQTVKLEKEIDHIRQVSQIDVTKQSFVETDLEETDMMKKDLIELKMSNKELQEHLKKLEMINSSLAEENRNIVDSVEMLIARYSDEIKKRDDDLAFFKSFTEKQKSSIEAEHHKVVSYFHDLGLQFLNLKSDVNNGTNLFNPDSLKFINHLKH